MLRLSQYMNSVLADSMMDIQFHLVPLHMQVSYSTVLDQMHLPGPGFTDLYSEHVDHAVTVLHRFQLTTSDAKASSTS